jgi:chromate transporter
VGAVVTRPTTVALLKYFLYLGSLGFGGPVALVGYMQRDLVEQRQWFTREEYMKRRARGRGRAGARARASADELEGCAGRGRAGVYAP